MNVHDGHRQRLKKRFLEQGLDGFDDHLVLELLLYFAIPRRDTNPIAHTLINHFGNLESIFDATDDELGEVEGLGENAVTLIKLLPAVGRRLAIAKTDSVYVLNSTEAAGSYIAPRFMYETDEVVYAVCLDAKNQVLCCKELFRGTPNSASISVRKIVELVIGKKASGVIIAHNHTSGIAIPSIEDEETTKRIKSALGHMGIALVDHIIVAGDDFVSMADSNMI